MTNAKKVQAGLGLSTLKVFTTRSLLLTMTLIGALILTGCNVSVTSQTSTSKQEKYEIPPPSTGISVEEDALIRPGPPGNIWISNDGGKTVIHWQGTRNDRVKNYVVYRKGDADWQVIGRVPSFGDNSSVYVFSETTITGFTYAVSAVSTRGVEGPKQPADPAQ